MRTHSHRQNRTSAHARSDSIGLLRHQARKIVDAGALTRLCPPTARGPTPSALALQRSPVERLKSGTHLRIPWIGPLTTTAPQPRRQRERPTSGSLISSLIHPRAPASIGLYRSSLSREEDLRDRPCMVIFGPENPMLGAGIKPGEDRRHGRRPCGLPSRLLATRPAES
jgi:hypothetical protein